MAIDPILSKAFQHHSAGRLGEAELLYQQVLSQNPKQPDALGLLGVLCSQTARHDKARDLLMRALAINPRVPHYHANLGAALAGEGRFDQAIPAYRCAIALDASVPVVHLNLGNALRQTGQLEEAVASYRQAIALNPRYVDALNGLAEALQSLGRIDEAIAVYRQVTVLLPGAIDAWARLAAALRTAGRLEEAVDALSRIVELDPRHFAALADLGSALQKIGRYEESISVSRRLIALGADPAVAHVNLCAALMMTGRFDEALAAVRHAISLRPDHAQAHWNLGLLLLLRGNYVEGFPELERHFRTASFAAIRTKFPQPQWDGAPLAGRRLLLFADQGLGDSIQFLRYLPMVQAAGGKVMLAIQPELHRLVRSAVHVDEQAVRESAAELDLCCPLSSLPFIFGTTPRNIPADFPYIFADAKLAAGWGARLPAGSRRKVGLVWAGSPKHANDRNRSIPAAALAPLGELQGITYVSLQKGPQAADAANLAGSLHPLDFSGELNDFADTAALIANLDLVISVDTAVVHLAGAMGKPVWVLLPLCPDWRWMLDRTDSPWYPSARLFRQPTLGDWQTPIGQVANALREMTEK